MSRLSNTAGLIANGAVELFTEVTAPAEQFGVFFYGSSQVQVPFRDGFRCVGGSVVRTPMVQTDPAGSVSLELDLTSAPGIASGTTQNFQFWFRDPTGPGGEGSNLSDGLEVTFCD